MKTPRAKARGFMLMKMTIVRFAPGAIHPQAEAWGLLAFSIKEKMPHTIVIIPEPYRSKIVTLRKRT